MKTIPVRPPLAVPTSYRLTKVTRIASALQALVFGVLAFLLFYITALRPPRPMLWPEIAFFETLALVLLAYAVYSAMRAKQPAEKLRVTSDGFTYRGLLKERHFAWSEVVRAKWELGGARRIAITLREPANPDTVRIELEGVAPPPLEFMIQVYHYAPETLELDKLMKKLGPPPGPPPDFEDMRAEARAVATGKDLEDLLKAADDLERLWKPHLDPNGKK